MSVFIPAAQEAGNSSPLLSDIRDKERTSNKEKNIIK